MANIREYTNTEKLTPNDMGFTARETAARRIGPLAKETAADVEKGGRLQGELYSQAEKAQALETKALGDESKGQAGKGSGSGGGSGVGSLNLLGGGRGSGGGGGGGGYAQPDVNWSDLANQVTYTAAALSGGNHGTDGHMGKLLTPGGGGNPLYTTGEYDSTPTATGSYTNQGSGFGDGGDMTPAQIATALKQGDARYAQNWQGRPILGDWNADTKQFNLTGRTYQPITSPGSDTVVNGVMVNGPDSGPTPRLSTWDQITAFAARGFSAIANAASDVSSGDLP